jgi:hypothetical protein
MSQHMITRVSRRLIVTIAPTETLMMINRKITISKRNINQLILVTYRDE